MDAQARRQVHAPPLPQARVEWAQGLDDAQPGSHGPLGVIFVRQGVTKVDEQAIPKVLRDMPLKAGDHLGAGLLIGAHDLAQVFRVELAGEWGRVDQVTEQDRELAAFRLWRSRSGRERYQRRHRSRLSGRLGRVLGGGRRKGGGRLRVTYPDQNAPVLVARQTLGVDQFDLEVFEIRVVQPKLTLYGAIGHPASALEQLYDLVE